MDIGITPALFLTTFFIAIVFAIWQYRRARIARKEHHRSAGAEARHEPRATDEPRV
jgi:CBS domain containing-hemolysin-like protein